MTTIQLRIGDTDVILNDFELGQGKLIISNDGYGYDFSYYWGAMGKETTLKDFICHISGDYFVGKLGPTEQGDIDLKATMKDVRAYWKKEGIPWYKEMDLQKDLRYELNKIERECYDDRHFVEMMGRIKDAFFFTQTSLSNGYVLKCDFEESLDELCSEPWNFIINKPHKKNVWLEKFHEKLKKALAE